VKPPDQGSMIIKTRGVHLVGVGGTLVVLSHNKQARVEHGNTCAHDGQVKTSCSNETPYTTFFISVTYPE
jgi:hypothetical protein